MTLHGGSLKLRHIMLGISTKNMTKLFKQHNAAMEYSMVTCLTVRESFLAFHRIIKLQSKFFRKFLSLVQDFY